MGFHAHLSVCCLSGRLSSTYHMHSCLTSCMPCSLTWCCISTRHVSSDFPVHCYLSALAPAKCLLLAATLVINACLLFQRAGQYNVADDQYVSGLAGRSTMCLHTGMTDAYVWDLGTPQERVASVAETRQILKDVDAVFRRGIGHLLYSHKVHAWTARHSKKCTLTKCFLQQS